MTSVGFFIKDSEDNEDVGNNLIISGLVIYMTAFGLSLGPVVWLYIPEIVEPAIVAFSTGSNWLSASIVIILFPILSNAIGSPASLFLFFAAWSLVSLFINQRYMI